VESSSSPATSVFSGMVDTLENVTTAVDELVVDTSRLLIQSLTLVATPSLMKRKIPDPTAPPMAARHRQ
jgi:hypothetical protein